MTLDLVRLATRIDELVTALEAATRLREARLARAERLLAQLDVETLTRAVKRSEHANWLMALPLEPPGTHRPEPPLSAAYAALATDGSSIDVSRHSPVPCYVLNIGRAFLDYDAAEAFLDNEADLAFSDDRLSLADQDNASRESAMTGNLLDAYRTAREMLALATLANGNGAARPLVALLDGQFVIWGLKESELSSSARKAIYDDGVLKALGALREIAERREFVLGSFISLPAAREVTNSLRAVACPREPIPDCQDCPRQPGAGRPCDDVAGGPDRFLFASLLGEGERSAIFRRVSSATDFTHADERYAAEGHELRYFYLHIPGGEIARVEFPEWVAADPAAVDLLHVTILDQCRLGNGYPVVLQEAHEQAVIDSVDRRSFAALVEREMEMRGYQSQTSGKATSKHRRTI